MFSQVDLMATFILQPILQLSNASGFSFYEIKGYIIVLIFFFVEHFTIFVLQKKITSSVKFGSFNTFSFPTYLVLKDLPLNKIRPNNLY